MLCTYHLQPWSLGTWALVGTTVKLMPYKLTNPPLNIRWLPCRAGQLRCRVTNQVLALIPRENPNKVPAQIPGLNDRHQAKAATVYMFLVSMHKFPALSWWVPHYYPGTQGLGIQMLSALHQLNLNSVCVGCIDQMCWCGWVWYCHANKSTHWMRVRQSIKQ